MNVDSIRLSWEIPEGQVTGYRVSYSSPVDGVRELFPAPEGDDDTAELHGLRPGTEYTVSIVALHDDKESKPVIGIQRTGIRSAWRGLCVRSSFVILQVPSTSRLYSCNSSHYTCV